ncbi:hypothetical protein V6N13_009481 [Hibiscus sabdariffa]
MTIVANKRELGIRDKIGEKSQASSEGNGLARVEGMGTTKFGPDKANPDGARFDTSRLVSLDSLVFCALNKSLFSLLGMPYTYQGFFDESSHRSSGSASGGKDVDA